MKRLYESIVFSIVLLLSNFSLAEETKNKNTFLTKVKDFATTYIKTEQNPIFGKNLHRIDVFFSDATLYYKINNKSYSVNYEEPAKNINIHYNGPRNLELVGFHYSIPNKILWFHGMFSAGFLYLYGIKGIWKDIYKSYGGEIIQEIIIGSPLLYITGGCGIGYFVEKVGRIGSSDRYGITHVNIAAVVRLGHRFEIKEKFGLNVEIILRHYSNGGIEIPNEGINFYGLSFGFTF